MVTDMARKYSKSDASRLKREHEAILNELRAATGKPEQYSGMIKNAADALVADEVANILKNIPVEELNRDKGGLRIKSLRDAGYENIADIMNANVHALEAINGISADASYTIKRIAQNIADEAGKGTRIRLNADSKNPKSTALVSLLYRYMTFSKTASDADNMLRENEQQVKRALTDMDPLTGTIKWFFATTAVRGQAENAFAYLSGMLDAEYGTSARNITGFIRNTETADDGTSWNDFKERSIEYFTTLENVYPGILSDSDEVYGLPEDLAREVQEESFYTDGLLCTLRRYQEWGVKYTLHEERVLLGDEMGLGKTVQAIASMVSLKNTGATHFIVVCPASVITNWCREIVKHSTLSVTKVHGPSRENALNEWIDNGGVAVTTYETTGYFNFSDDFRFTMLVVDEAHYIKNPDAARSKNVKKICEHADRMLFMTGTALENKVDEMISLIDILKPDIARSVKSKAFMASAPQFRDLVSPVYYRRKREQVLTELPELIEKKEWCTMTPKEEEIYEETVFLRNFMAMRRVSWNADDINDSSKAKRLLEIVEDAKEDDRKVIVFSYFLDVIKVVCDLLGDVCTEPINGSVSPARRQEIIDEFDKAPAGTVLPAQIQSGGTGLNIQSASVVVLCEPQYKPSIENQAISRAYRMGQARNVLVFRLLCDDTVDERILEILDRKQAEFDAFADSSVAAAESIELDETTFGDIIEEEIKRIKEKNAL